MNNYNEYYNHLNDMNYQQKKLITHKLNKIHTQPT